MNRKIVQALFILLLVASVASAQTLEVPEISAPLQSCFIASATAQTYQSSGFGFVIASFGAEIYDAKGEFNTSTSAFTAAKAYTKFQVSYKIFVPNAVGNFNAALYVGGVEYTPSFCYLKAPSDDGSVSCTTILYNVAAGTTIDLRCKTAAGGTADLRISFCGYELP